MLCEHLGAVQASIERELAARKTFLQGCDEYGRAVLVIQARRHSARARDYEETLRLIVYTLDAAVMMSDLSRNPDAHLLVLFDLSGGPTRARPRGTSGALSTVSS